MRLWLKEVEGGAPTVGTRTGREAGRGRRAGEQTRSPKSIKTRQVEPDGTDLELLALPEETFDARAPEESAEVVVVKKAGEPRKDRRNQRETIRSIALGPKPAPTSIGAVVNNEPRNEPQWAKRETRHPGQQLRVHHMLHVGQTAQADLVAADLLLHAWQRAGRAECPGRLEHRVEHPEPQQRKVVGREQLAPGVLLGRRGRSFIEHRLQTPLKSSQQFPVGQVGFGHFSFSFGASSEHAPIKPSCSQILQLHLGDN